MFLRFKILLIMMSSCQLVACTKWLETKTKNNENNQLSPSTKKDQILEVTASVNADSVDITIEKIPESTTLHCEIDYVTSEKCAPKMTLDNLQKGEYLLHVLAKRDGQTVAVGEAFFTFGVSTNDTLVFQESSEMKLEKSDSSQNGEARDIKNDITFSFKPVQKLNCKADFECSLGDQEATFWKPCSSNTEHNIGRNFLAKGLQYLHVRAKCDNKIGPILSYYFYGVSERYFKAGKPQKLTLDYMVDREEKKYIFRLMKANDCDEVKLSYECETGSGFLTCDPVHTKPPSTLKIRAKCGNEQGPVVAIKDIDAT